MSYRVDWQVTLRAVQRPRVTTFLLQIGETLQQEIDLHGAWPSRTLHSCWNCRFSTPDWPLPFAEAVVRSMRLAERLGRGWQFSLPEEHAEAFTGLFTDERSTDRMLGLARAALLLVPASSPRPPAPPVPDIAFPAQPGYRVVIEALDGDACCCCAPDSHSTVSVHFDGGERWLATVYTARYLQEYHLSAPDGYFWEPDAVLVAEITRPAVEAAIADLLQRGTFQQAFTWLGGDDALVPE